VGEIVVHVEADVNLTESAEKVQEAITNIFAELNLQTKPVGKAIVLIGEARGRDSLTCLRDLLRREHIRSAARAVFLEGAGRKSLRFCVNKQVAYVGHLSFSKETGESPLGPIRVTIECDDPRELIEWLASRST